MQNFKKNLGFNLALIVLAAVFLGGCVMAYLAYAGAAKPAAVEDKRVPVVMRKLSSFVVQVDYLSIAEEKPPVSAEGEPKK